MCGARWRSVPGFIPPVIRLLRGYAPCAALFGSIAFGAPLVALAQTAPSSQPTTVPLSPPPGNFDVHEWVVMVYSPLQQTTNADALFESTLPPTAGSRRHATTDPADLVSLPQPMGVIRVDGTCDRKVDISIGIGQGKSLAAWPHARSRANKLLWQQLSLRPEPVIGSAAVAATMPTTNSMTGDDSLDVLSPIENLDGSWLADLRGCNSEWLASDEGTDRFLAYDVELPYVAPLSIASGGNFTFTLASSAALNGVHLYKADGNGWRVADVGMLPATQSEQSKTIATPARPTPRSRRARAHPVPAAEATAVAVNPPTTSLVSGIFTTGPSTTGPSTAASATTMATSYPTSQTVTFTLAAVAATQSADVMEPWRGELSHRGVAPPDIDTIVHILAANVLDPKRVTAVYELSDADMDHVLPLEVLPDARRITRVGLVIVRDIDPGMSGEIDGWVAQLGSDDWHTREMASKELQKVGKAAMPQLENASKSSDAEVAWRAERLMAPFKSQQPSDQ